MSATATTWAAALGRTRLVEARIVRLEVEAEVVLESDEDAHRRHPRGRRQLRGAEHGVGVQGGLAGQGRRLQPADVVEQPGEPEVLEAVAIDPQ